MLFTHDGFADHLVGEVLNLTDFLGRHLAEVREVKAQRDGIDV